ncbi:PhoH family protein [Planctomicrobium piriforme]|uniref:PhoH-like ATPase n=1 Tax=Planctomicrobium piriforme TaxID=1576369 RepID=A0A1I3CEB7_9PLAN|nr:PhoH family protein [Planctomicrobium piriforme]SFH72860.1 PhoH-like ATPase [Planctomicrobium piriforme]
MLSGGNARPKLFVLDTNVILHDSSCLKYFEENDLAVPITVLEELDQFKKGNGEIHHHAREFLRALDELTDDVLCDSGARISPEHGSVRVILGTETDPRLKALLLHDSADHRILNTALWLKQQEPERQVILITKDTNLRMKAKSFGLPAQDYTTDKAESVDRLYTGKRVLTNLPSTLIDRFYDDAGHVEFAAIPGLETATPNENFVLKNGSKSALATCHGANQYLSRINKPSAFGISARNSEQVFALTALLDDSIQLVTLTGKAGSGKTILALAAGLECRRNYRQILLSRPTVPLSNKDLGFLPGDINAKLDPYMQPLFDNLSVIRQEQGNGERGDKLQDLLDSQKLEITPLAYIRGRSLQKVFFIVDEAQNLTPHEVKTIITRAGEGTKIILTGDIRQIDHPYLDSRSNGLTYLINRMKGQSLYAHIALEKSERSVLAELASDLL